METVSHDQKSIAVHNSTPQQEDSSQLQTIPTDSWQPPPPLPPVSDLNQSTNISPHLMTSAHVPTLNFANAPTSSNTTQPMPQNDQETTNSNKPTLFPAKVLFILIAPITACQTGLTLFRQPYFIVMLAIIFVITSITATVFYKKLFQDTSVDTDIKTHQTLNGGVFLYLFVRLVITIIMLILTLTWLVTDLSANRSIVIQPNLLASYTSQKQFSTQLLWSARQAEVAGTGWIVLSILCFFVALLVQLGVRIASTRYHKIDGIQYRGIVSFYAFTGFGFGAASSIEIASYIGKVVDTDPFNKTVLWLLPILNIIAVIGVAVCTGVSAARRDFLDQKGYEWAYVMIGALGLAAVYLSGYLLVLQVTIQFSGHTVTGVLVSIFATFLIMLVAILRYFKLKKDADELASITA